MKRDLNSFQNDIFDLLVVGGGISGAFTCWLGAKAGLKVALIEQKDFAHATSANSQKIIHGGLRYLQHFDIRRVIQSIRSRGWLMSLAPHLVRPLRCAMPIYGYSSKGTVIMASGINLYNLISAYCSSREDNLPPLPKARIVDKETMLRSFPAIDQHELRGGAEWFEGVCQNTERLVVAFIKSANRLGAVVANYLEALKYLERSDGTIIVTARDNLSNQEFDIKTKRAVNCIGPYHSIMGDRSVSNKRLPIQHFAAGLNLVTKPIFNNDTAIGLKSSRSRQSRLFFILPWRDRSIIGTEWYGVEAPFNELKPSEQQCQDFIKKFNAVYPSANLGLDDIKYLHWGFVPCAKNFNKRQSSPRILTKPKIFDISHDNQNRILNVIAIKYTTAGDLAGSVLNRISPDAKVNRDYNDRLVGADADNLISYKMDIQKKWGESIGEKEIDRLLTNYGTESNMILDLASKINNTGISKESIIMAETKFAIRHEMALKLSDIIFRRTDLGTAGVVKEDTLTMIADTMKDELNWSTQRAFQEKEDVRKTYPQFIG